MKTKGSNEDDCLQINFIPLFHKSHLC